MQIFINETSVSCQDNATLSGILEMQGIEPKNIAIAINNTVIPKSQWDSYTVTENSRILIIKAVQGG